VVSFTPRPLYPQGKSPWYPLDRKLSGPQRHSGRGEEKNYFLMYKPQIHIINHNFYVLVEYLVTLVFYACNTKLVLSLLYNIEKEPKICLG
jgi:hypothetical protein